MVPSLPLLFCESSVSVKENPEPKPLYAIFVVFFIMWYKQDIKRNCLIISFKPFPIFYSSRKLYNFPVLKTNMGSIFVILSGWFSMSWWCNATVTEYWKHLLSLRFFGFVLAMLFTTYSGDFMYDFPLFRFVFWIS